MDLPGLVLVPGEMNGIRNRFTIKVGPRESEEPSIRQKKRPAQRSVRQILSRSEGKRRGWSGRGLKSEYQ